MKNLIAAIVIAVFTCNLAISAEFKDLKFPNLGDVEFTQDQIEFLNELEEDKKFGEFMKGFMDISTVALLVVSTPEDSFVNISGTDFEVLYKGLKAYKTIVTASLRNKVAFYLINEDGNFTVKQRKFFEQLHRMLDNLV